LNIGQNEKLKETKDIGDHRVVFESSSATLKIWVTSKHSSRVIGGRMEGSWRVNIVCPFPAARLATEVHDPGHGTLSSLKG